MFTRFNVDLSVNMVLYIGVNSKILGLFGVGLVKGSLELEWLGLEDCLLDDGNSFLGSFKMLFDGLVGGEKVEAFSFLAQFHFLLLDAIHCDQMF